MKRKTKTSSKEMEANDSDIEKEEEDEGEAHLDKLYKNVSLDKEDIDDFEAHDLTQKERKKYVDDMNEPISKATHSMYALFRDMLTYNLFAKRQEIINSGNPIDEDTGKRLLSKELFAKMVSSIKIAKEFKADIKKVQALFLNLIADRDKNPQYKMLNFIIQNCIKATRIRVIPLSDIMQLVPSISTDEEPVKSTLTCDNLEFQKTAVANQGCFLNIHYPKDGETKYLNVTVTKQQMAMIASFLFLDKVLDRVLYEVDKKIMNEDETASVDNIIDKHIEKDSKQMIPYYAKQLTRSITRLAKLFPEVKDKIPKYLLNVK